MDQIIHRFFSDISTVVTESTSELAILFIILILFTAIVFMGFYVYNRTRKLNKLDRQIPASLVRSYLNSIIKNSSDLKDSLFLEEGATENDIVSLKSQLKEKERIIEELSKEKSEKASATPSQEMPILMDDKVNLEELDKMTKERDELLLRISDYQKAEEDFANLKKLKQENEDLKKRLGEPISEPPAEETTKLDESKILEFEQAQVEEKPAENKPDQTASSNEKLGEIAKEEKSAEDLLKEFEKMLG